MENGLIRQLCEKSSKLCWSDDARICKELKLLNIDDQL